MRGSWRWNVIVASVGGGLIALLAMGHNPIETMLIRVVIAWMVLFVVTYVIRWLFDQAFVTPLIDESPASSEVEQQAESSHADAQVGMAIDYMTPDDSGSSSPPQPGDPGFFMPLFVSKKTNSSDTTNHNP